MIAKVPQQVFVAVLILASAPWNGVRGQELPATAPATVTPTQPEAHSGVSTGDALPCDSKTPWWRRWSTRCREKCEACEAAREGTVTPLGETVYAPVHVQIDNGVTARMVLYNCDFVEGSERLSVHGRDELARVATWALHHPCPIIVERTPYCPGLDEARRKAVVQELARSSLPINAERVIVAPAVANGLSGSDAEIMFRRMNSHTQSGGILSGVSGGQSFIPSGFTSGAAQPTPR